MIIKFLFWLLVIFCLYAYIGYPILLIVLSIFKNKPVGKRFDHMPSVSIIVAAYNEEKSIEAKIKNLLNQKYDKNKYEILIASNGSKDSTNEIATAYTENYDYIKLLTLKEAGKASALNEAVKMAKGEILVFSDANAILHDNSLAHLVANFADGDIGGVAGNQHYNDEDTMNSAGLGEVLYWKYDRKLKEIETRVGNAISADGALYAIRRKLYVPIEDFAATDDFSISTRVITQGYRLVYDPEAIVAEATTGSSNKEFKRKARIINRGLRSLFGLKEYLLPWNGGFYSIQLISHKFLRRLVPFVLPFLFVLSAILSAEHLFYQLLFWGQSLVYILGIIGYVLRNTTLGRKWIIYIPYYFCQVNAAAALGFIWFIRGQKIISWQPQREEN